MFVGVKTVFPNGGGYFDFRSYGSGKNTIADPRLADGTAVAKGALKKGETMRMNVSSSGDFSTAEIVFHGNAEDADRIGEMTVVRAYRAYVYPEGDAVSCARSETIASTDEGFFALRDGEWIPFVSDRAFHSRFRDEDATVITSEQFSRYPVSESRIGFLDGTVVSYGDSAYVVEGETLRPIDSIDTFLSKGYAWSDVVAMTGEEFGMYTRGKLYTKREPHPNGTVFSEEGTGKLFLIDGGKKREIPATCASRFASIRAIPASVADLGSCTMRRGWFSFGCSVDWKNAQRGTGAEYELTYAAKSGVTLRDAEVVFTREKNAHNFGLFLTDIVDKLKTRYPFL